MTEFLDANIQTAMMTQLTIPDLGYQIAMPFIPYAPKEGTPYLDVRPMMRAKTRHPGLGYNDASLNTGILQIDAVIPDGQGEAPGSRIATKVAERFALGTTLTAGTRKLQINSVVQTTMGIKDGAWVRFPVSITWTVIA